MLPREHGAYGQLLFPVVTALLVARPGAAAFAIAAAAVAAFLSHESLLVLLGQRGQRAARELGAAARRWFAACAGAAAMLGVAGIWLATPAARAALLIPIALAAVLGVWIARRQEHTTSGEILSAVSLSSLALPIALAAGASRTAAFTVRAGVRDRVRRRHGQRARGDPLGAQAPPASAPAPWPRSLPRAASPRWPRSRARA